MTPRPAAENRTGKKKRRFRARLKKSRGGKRLVVRGRAPRGSRLKVRLVRRGGKTVAKRRFTTKRRRWVKRFRVERSGRYRAVVTGRKGDRVMRKRTRLVRIRL
jgi:hypothetical protein